jgi:hypothetical protein
MCVDMYHRCPEHHAFLSAKPIVYMRQIGSVVNHNRNSSEASRSVSNEVRLVDVDIPFPSTYHAHLIVRLPQQYTIVIHQVMQTQFKKHLDRRKESQNQVNEYFRKILGDD